MSPPFAGGQALERPTQGAPMSQSAVDSISELSASSSDVFFRSRLVALLAELLGARAAAPAAPGARQDL
ncbi:hypothetical protein, partial [Burkholderia pseudomallei]|uniref:hypothetical protein n=1 Tax=Burkholderia pseudomallei TaxID=28450 RepID=UPI001C4CED13